MKWQLIGNLAGKDGTNGEDAKPIDRNAIVADVLAKVPAPKDAKQVDVDAIVEEVTNIVRASIPVPKDGKDGINGTSVDPMLVKALIASEVSEAFSKVRIPADGKDADPKEVAAQVRAAVDAIPKPDVAELVRSEVERAVKSIQPMKGDSGKDYDPTVMQAQVVLEVDKAVRSLPKPEVNEAEIASEVFDRVMRSIPMPKDGQSVTVEDVKPLLEGEVSRWELDFERRAHDVLQRAYERMPKPKDGRDGVGLNDFIFRADSPDGGRTFVFEVNANGRSQVATVKTAAMLDAGVWKQGSSYERGDSVSYGGQLYIAQKDTANKPGESGDWRLSVRRGKDGKDSE